jgi:hypothetical protein
MKYLLVTLVLSLFSGQILCEESLEFDYNKDTLSDKWYAGPALVYDCEEMHWACVAAVDHKKCGYLRESALEIGKETLDCAPSEVFEYRNECHQTMQRLINEASYPRICLNPRVRARFIGFR